MGSDWPDDRREFAYKIVEATEERCRAWQAFRDFLNGTPEQWVEQVGAAYDRGVAAVLYRSGRKPHWEAKPYTGDDHE